jgi:hypothetical protein
VIPELLCREGSILHLDPGPRDQRIAEGSSFLAYEIKLLFAEITPPPKETELPLIDATFHIEGIVRLVVLRGIRMRTLV